jgi:hypothetical protein
MPLQLGTSMLLTKIEHFPMFLIWKDPALSILITAWMSEHNMDLYRYKITITNEIIEIDLAKHITQCCF